MSFEHDRLAHAANKLLLSQLQNNGADWATPRLTASATYWQGIADYPRPDGAFQDKTTGASLAIEFKPPGQIKREYVTGLGQVLTYLRTFEYAAIVVPKLAGDGFEIGQYLAHLLREPFAAELPLGLFTYDKDPSNSSDLTSVVHLRERHGVLPGIPKGIGRKVFWGYWRDLSQHDLLSILIELDARPSSSFDQGYRRFWRRFLVKGRAKKWEGGFRKAKDLQAPSFYAEQRNAYYSLRHSGFINADGSLTEEGYKLQRIGKIYGADSVAFKKFMASQILDEGRHLELIFWIDEQQRLIPPERKTSSAQYCGQLDSRLYDAGVIPKIPGGAKPCFLRDEPKLWNKLGLLIPFSSQSYFHPGIGFLFNWRAIVAMVSS